VVVEKAHSLMKKQTNPNASLGTLLDIRLERDARRPLFRRLHATLRARILARELPRGARLPSTRDLAERLGISRASVVAAYEQLLAEGFIEGRVGAGSYVAVDVPAERRSAARAVPTAAPPQLSRRTRRMPAAPQPEVPPAVPFETGMVQLDSRLRAAWRAAILAQATQVTTADLRYGDAAGDPKLRAAVADYLRVARGMRAEPDNVLITSGSQQSYDLIIKLLLDPGDPAWVEDPGYPALRAALIASGVRLLPVPVDPEGMDVARAIAEHARARVVFVTPSHHYPTGATLALGRRVQLVEWAERNDAWIVEDDYDGEFRFASAPFSPLQALGRAGRVVYLGTFNKVLFPGLRLGYVVADPGLITALSDRARREADSRCRPRLDALMRVTTTTICGTDVEHILKGEYPVAAGLTIGHEPVGVIEKLGSAVEGYREGQRVIAGAITPSGHSNACLRLPSQDGAGNEARLQGDRRLALRQHDRRLPGRVPARARRHGQPRADPGRPRPTSRCSCAPTSCRPGSRARNAATSASATRWRCSRKGPIGLCATAGARLMGATTIIGVETVPARIEMARGWARTTSSISRKVDPVDEIMRLTDGRGVDVAIEALGTQETFEAALRVPAARRHALEPRRLFGRSQDPARRLRGRARRPHDRHHALPGRQGADAPADGRHRLGPARSEAARHAPLQARRHREGLRSLRATSATAC
jgi:GntR family transcriptional regulator / MocR family aminotransferase